MVFSKGSEREKKDFVNHPKGASINKRTNILIFLFMCGLLLNFRDILFSNSVPKGFWGIFKVPLGFLQIYHKKRAQQRKF